MSAKGQKVKSSQQRVTPMNQRNPFFSSLVCLYREGIARAYPWIEMQVKAARQIA
jgi:hypothetical protein